MRGAFACLTPSSGTLASAAPQHYAPHTKIQREAFSDFPTLLTARLATELHLVGTEFLTGHGIGEPVSWNHRVSSPTVWTCQAPNPPPCPGNY